MRRPQDAMKAAVALQGFATLFYTIFAVVTYIYIGDTVLSPSFSSLPTKWMKAAYGIAIPNLLIAGSLYSHTAAKIYFIRLFRKTDHLHSHTVLGWATWVGLILLMNGAAFILAVGVPIFSILIGLAASLFASWYTYGIAGFFWLYDHYHLHGGIPALKKAWKMSTLSVLTILAGAFICVAGTYSMIKAIVDSYREGTVGEPFSCSMRLKSRAMTSPGMNPLSLPSDSRQPIPSFLLQPPKKWTSEHFRTLKVIQQDNLPAEAIIEARYLPSDEDEGDEVSQILLQGFLAYDQDPTLKSYTAFVLRMSGTILQFNVAVIPRIYIEELCEGRPLSENLRLSCSESYDLQECDRRREALKVLIGLCKFLSVESVK
ncbi:MAG: hypothetical protein M1834_008655 [Cirrosporium novae-zelandiae]|nr:MAG: hypothetical protein M1834_008655 [Cirrosporium novae-zelandiae]